MTAAGLLLAAMGTAQTAGLLEREAAGWVETRTGFFSPGALSRLRVESRGLVIVQGGGGNQIAWRVKNHIRVERESDARRILGEYAPRLRSGGGSALVSMPQSGDSMVYSELEVRVPSGVRFAAVSNALGDILLRDLPLEVDAETGGGRVDADRLGGRLAARSSGGEILLGPVGGEVRATTGGGAIQARSLGADSGLETAGGEIFVERSEGSVSAISGAGGVQVMRARGAVNARTAGGSIKVLEAGGGVRCESMGGGIRLAGAGNLFASTLLGAIFAELLAGGSADSILETESGDITVLIPSRLAVTVQAVNDSGRDARIMTEFPEIHVRGGGGRMVASGALNGGGPLLKVAAAKGTIYLKRQR